MTKTYNGLFVDLEMNPQPVKMRLYDGNILLVR